MGHNHDHSHGSGHLGLGLVLNSAYTVIEFVAGVLTGSVALMSDAAHNLTDVLTLGTSYWADKIARKNPNERKTYGYGRATIIAALANASVMIAVSAAIIVGAIMRMVNPEPVEGGIVALVALGGIAINGFIAYLLSRRKQDLNIKSAYIDMLFDTVSSVGAVVSGVVIYFTHVYWIDSAVGIAIACLLAYNAVKILLEAGHILYDGTPSDVDFQEVKRAILSVDHVLNVHDLHIRSIRSGYNSLSCHVVVPDSLSLPQANDIRKGVSDLLESSCSIQHSTIQTEPTVCTVSHLPRH